MVYLLEERFPMAHNNHPDLQPPLHADSENHLYSRTEINHPVMPWRRTLDAHFPSQGSARARPRPLGLIIVDVDNFHRINEHWGLDAGDRLLNQIAQRLRTMVGAANIVLQLDGDSFCVVVSTPSDENAVTSLANKMVWTFDTHLLQVGSESVRITISAGSAYASAVDRPMAHALFVTAQDALRRAKREGKNQTVMARHNPYGTIVGDFNDQMVLDALTTHALRPSYQPVVKASDLKPIGAEALVRWHTADSIRLPGAFLPAIETLGLTDRLDRAILTQALEHCAGWNRSHPNRLLVGVNIAPTLLYHPTFPRQLDAILTHTGVGAEHLVLEISERTADPDSTRVIAALREMKTMGVFLALDDFGAGSTSLGLLKNLPLDSVKIDMQFIRGIGVHSVDELIIQQIVTLARHLGLVAVAEGVETSQQHQFLVSIGCPQIQGFLISPAMGAEDFENWARSRSGPFPAVPS